MDEFDLLRLKLVRMLAAMAGTFTFFPSGQEKPLAHHKSQRQPAEVYAEAALSPYFCNLRMADNAGDKQGSLSQASVDLIGECLFQMLPKDERVSEIAGIPNAGTPIAAAVYRAAIRQGIVLKQAIFRKTEGELGRAFERISEGNAPVEAVFDDVITLADVKSRFLKTLPNKPPLYVLIDRQEGGVEILKALGYQVRTALSTEDVLRECLENGRIDNKMADRVRAYGADRRLLINRLMPEILEDLRASAG